MRFSKKKLSFVACLITLSKFLTICAPPPVPPLKPNPKNAIKPKKVFYSAVAPAPFVNQPASPLARPARFSVVQLLPGPAGALPASSNGMPRIATFPNFSPEIVLHRFNTVTSPNARQIPPLPSMTHCYSCGSPMGMTSPSHNSQVSPLSNASISPLVTPLANKKTDMPFMPTNDSLELPGTIIPTIFQEQNAQLANAFNAGSIDDDKATEYTPSPMSEPKDNIGQASPTNNATLANNLQNTALNPNGNFCFARVLSASDFEAVSSGQGSMSSGSIDSLASPCFLASNVGNNSGPILVSFSPSDNNYSQPLVLIPTDVYSSNTDNGDNESPISLQEPEVTPQKISSNPEKVISSSKFYYAFIASLIVGAILWIYKNKNCEDDPFNEPWERKKNNRKQKVLAAASLLLGAAGIGGILAHLIVSCRS